MQENAAALKIGKAQKHGEVPDELNAVMPAANEEEAIYTAIQNSLSGFDKAVCELKYFMVNYDEKTDTSTISLSLL